MALVAFLHHGEKPELLDKLLEKAEKAYFKRVEEVVGTIEPAQIQMLTQLLAVIRGRLD